LNINKLLPFFWNYSDRMPGQQMKMLSRVLIKLLQISATAISWNIFRVNSAGMEPGLQWKDTDQGAIDTRA
jgi:hypothetical protein